MAAGLLERTEELGTLDAALASAAGGRGSVVLVAGEAGIGKSTLIRSFTAGPWADTRVLAGACDDLITPRTLGAVREAFSGRSPRLEELLARGARDDLLAGVLAELTDPVRPTVLVVEDVHWADDATLDVLRYVCRRVERTSAVVVVSYRDDEIGRDHPAQRLLGGLTGVPVHRLAVPHLSAAAVASLAGGTALASAELYRLTGGNPFYVTEVVADGDGAAATGAPRPRGGARRAPRTRGRWSCSTPARSSRRWRRSRSSTSSAPGRPPRSPAADCATSASARSRTVRAGPRAPTPPASRPGRSTSCACSPRGSPTGRSRHGW
ncbi:hypothetical protein Acsp06_05080 [Actinomycetospora sp. NBRC 106375]|uniref:ATP-binding protein n=1 Tax=Actinomycetospora sp. NBRC 106375 TaxID=3032207 RepID=UPI0024A3AF03|nr:AAA family ATPase [Actinomycetospora sp. NBRC 106375]GLZ44323.1 hypothetical protein Acsp06_05080 [Actinomycetospora sp. NBRC 106375]